MSDTRRGLVPTAALVLSVALGACWGSAAATLPDPTQPPSYRAARTSANAQPSPWALTSTLITQDRRVATINGQRVQVGDRVRGARVVEIAPTHVRLSVNGKQRVLRLVPRTVKQIAEDKDEHQ